ncbi:MAG TPA: DUF58 domain-containing protein [Terriglobales bacterium]
MTSHHLLPDPISASGHPARKLAYGFGSRFLLLFAVGFAWIVPAFWNRTFLYGLVAWDAVLLAAWIIDLMALPRPENIQVERSWIGVPAIECTSQVVLTVVNGSRITIHCSLDDDLPVAFKITRPIDKVSVSSHRRASVRYSATPNQRGDLKTGKAYLRAQTGVHFAERWYAFDLAQELRIYPNIEGAKKNTIFLTRSRQIELEKRRLRQRGLGREFESLRDYQDGDEIRDICWSASARRGKLITRVYNIERSQPIWVVLDTGRLLRAQVGELNKLDFAAEAALNLAQLALYSGDRVGLLGYGRQIKHRVPLGRGLPHLRAIVEELALAKPEVAEADHLRAAGFLLSMQKRRGLIVWLTDLAETAMTPEVIEGASLMLKRNLVLFMAIGDNAMANKAASRPRNTEQMYEMVAAQEMIQRREILISRLRDRGALAMEVAPGQLSVAVMNQYLMIKERSLI